MIINVLIIDALSLGHVGVVEGQPVGVGEGWEWGVSGSTVSFVLLINSSGHYLISGMALE